MTANHGKPNKSGASADDLSLLDMGFCPGLGKNQDNADAYKPKKRVVLVDNSYPFRKRFRQSREIDSLCDRETFVDVLEFKNGFEPKPIDLLILEVNRESEVAFQFFKTAWDMDIAKLVPVCQYVCAETLDRSVQIGADDLLVKTKHLDFINEVKHLLQDPPCPSEMPIQQNTIFTSCFLRCAGLSESETQLLKAFYPNCPSMKEIAYALNKSQGCVRKGFSNIYRKLNVSNSAQLAQLLTLCYMLRQRKKLDEHKRHGE